MILHKLTDSPFTHASLEQCLAIADKTDALLLTQDAVYLLQDTARLQRVFKSVNTVYSVKDDLLARGIRAHPGVQNIDYAGMVDVCLAFKQVVSW